MAHRCSRCRCRTGTEHGSFFAPRAFLLEHASELRAEIFGPVLCVVRYAADRLDEVLDAIDATGYGLTLGIHSRIEATQRRIADRLRIGNTYVNRNQIGAVVGVQPFGGRGLSGTGPKAGRPDHAVIDLPRSGWYRSTRRRPAAMRPCWRRTRIEHRDASPTHADGDPAV